MFYWDTSYSISNYLSASPNLVFEKGQYWRLLTTTFIHGDIHHLMSNSLMLFILTYFVTAFFGLKISIILSYAMGILINAIVISQYSSETTLVGASGIVYFLWGFWMAMFIGISKQLTIFQRLIRVGGIFLILLVPTTYSPTTSYLAHYIGYIIGIISGFICYIIKRKEFANYEFWEYRVVPNLEDNEFKDYSSTSSRL